MRDKADVPRKHVVMVCTAAKGGMRAVVEGYRASGVFTQWSVVWLTPHAEGTLPFRLMKALRAYLALLWLLVRGSACLVHCHAAMRGSFWRKGLFAGTALLFRVPVIFHLHGSETDKFIDAQSGIWKRLIVSILTHVSVVVVLSDSWRRYISGVAPAARVEVLPNYVKMPALAADRAASAGTEVTFLFLGAVGKRKGVYPLVEAFAAAVQRTQVPLRLVVGGDGEIEQAKAHCRQLGVESRVSFLGWISGQTKDDWLQQAEVYVLPSFHEGLPVSLLEAMSCGIPVVSTTVGGIPELVRDGVDGFLVPAGDVARLADRLVELAENPAMRIDFGQAGRQRVLSTYSEAAVLPRLNALYAKLLEPRT